MSRAVLISINPKWCELIASGEKTIEVRKTRPKLETPFKCYIYRTKGTVRHLIGGKWVNMPVGGTVIGEFVCDRFTYIEAGYDTNENKHLYNTAFIEHRMCIPNEELHRYLYKSRENCGGWAWHISGLMIYARPLKLSNFVGLRKTKFGYEPVPVNRPPQSWCYVEEMGGD